ncbi:MAG: hypothetical protein RIB47_06010 [Cyclobacteriaceae bacterium]
MNTATVHEIKRALEDMEATQIRALCLRLAKFKKDNKELLTYLLFEAHDEEAFITSSKRENAEAFTSIPNVNVYYLKKSVRRILRSLNKLIKYSGQPVTELELRIDFCKQVLAHQIPLNKSVVLRNLYDQQVKKIKSVLAKLDEDLQYDYRAALEMIDKK